MSALTLAARLLVVEDEALIAEELSDRLRRLGYEIVGDESTAEGAMIAAEEMLPDLVLMDIRLKGTLDGIAAAEHIYSVLDIPVVYLTAHSDEATLGRAKGSFPFGYLMKPIQEKELIVAIEMALQRHGMERRLKESEVRYATTLRSIGEGVVATDVARRVTFMNPAAESLTGWTLAQAEGQPISQVVQLVDERDRAIAEHPVDQALRYGKAVRFAVPLALIDRGGREIPVEDSAAPILDAAGEIVGAVLALRDCREKRAASEALRKAEDRLQEAVRLEAIGRLAGGVAHDFNNMLTVILGCCELLEVSLDVEETDAALVHEILEAARRASALTDQLLAFSRQRVHDSRVVDLGALLRGLEPLLRRLVGADVEVALELCAEALPVSVDPSHFEQAVVNLAANARDAMAKDGGALTIRTSRADRAPEPEPGSAETRLGAWAVLSVVDTGHGMDEVTCARIFEPFFTTKPVGRGAGLGLASLYGTVKESGGHLTVESELGRGTAFTLWLPLVDVEAAEEGGSERPVRDARGTETILLVEDDAAVRRLAVASLRSFGYTVVDVEDGDEALRRFDELEAELDMLVTDIVLPGMTGRQIAARITARAPRLPVLYLSGHVDDESLRRELSDSDVSFLRKPFTPVELARRVRELLGG